MPVGALVCVDARQIDLVARREVPDAIPITTGAGRILDSLEDERIVSAAADELDQNDFLLSQQN